MRKLSLFLVALLCLPLPALADDARTLQVKQSGNSAGDQRVALVIGNSDYRSGALRNPVNDAQDVAAKLRALGFSVVERHNLQIRQIGRTLGEFRSRLTPGSVALVFYAGHGLQIKGENYFPAVDADIAFEEDVPNQSLSMQQVMDVLEGARTRLNLVFLDACRNNPYARSFRSLAGDGLARVNAPSGTLISYATRPGSVAADGDGRNGLYTSKLLRQMDSKQQIELALKHVVSEVKTESQGRQEPWMEGSIEGDFCFAGCRAGLTSPATTASPSTSPTPSANGRIEIAALPPGMDVWLDNRKLDAGETGKPIDINSGSHLVVARMGSLSWEQTIEATPGDPVPVPVSLDSSPPALSTSLLTEVFDHIEKNYVTQPDWNNFLFGALGEMAKAVPGNAISVSRTNTGAALEYTASNRIPARAILPAPATAAELQQELMLGAGLARKLAPALNQSTLEQAILSGGLSNLDAHSHFLTPVQSQEMTTSSRGSFGGLGMTVVIKQEMLTVVTPLAGAPADRAGIRAGDRIVAIDGKPTQGRGLDESVRQMRGTPGTSANLEVMREGWSAPREFTVTREIIHIQSLRSRDLGQGIGYFAISGFLETTPENLQAELDKWQTGTFGANPLRGIVLDIRNNPGGFLNAVADVTGKFLKEGSLIITADGRLPDSKIRLSAKGEKHYTDIPMVVLVNQGTSSGGEALAGALQDAKRALIVGNRTSGKGSIQRLFPLAGGGALNLMVAIYRTPSGRIIENRGIEPDVLVNMPSANSQESDDLQLQTALARLKERMGVK